MLKLPLALCLLMAFSIMAQEPATSHETPANATENDAATSAQAEEARGKAEELREKLPTLQLQAGATLRKLTEKTAGLCSIPLVEVPVSPGAHILKQVTPNLKSLALMPQGKGPVPPCPSIPR